MLILMGKYTSKVILIVHYNYVIYEYQIIFDWQDGLFSSNLKGKFCIKYYLSTYVAFSSVTSALMVKY